MFRSKRPLLRHRPTVDKFEEEWVPVSGCIVSFKLDTVHHKYDECYVPSSEAILDEKVEGHVSGVLMCNCNSNSFCNNDENNACNYKNKNNSKNNCKNKTNNSNNKDRYRNKEQ